MQPLPWGDLVYCCNTRYITRAFVLVLICVSRSWFLFSSYMYTYFCFCSLHCTRYVCMRVLCIPGISCIYTRVFVHCSLILVLVLMCVHVLVIRSCFLFLCMCTCSSRIYACSCSCSCCCCVELLLHCFASMCGPVRVLAPIRSCSMLSVLCMFPWFWSCASVWCCFLFLHIFMFSFVNRSCSRS